MLCSGQEGFRKMSLLFSFLLQTHLLVCSTSCVSVCKAPVLSPRQPAQAAQLLQEPQQEGTAKGEVLELSNTFPP